MSATPWMATALRVRDLEIRLAQQAALDVAGEEPEARVSRLRGHRAVLACALLDLDALVSRAQRRLAGELLAEAGSEAATGTLPGRV